MERLAMAPDYPAPIVDHAAQKVQALSLFQRT
jgi:deoxyribodipyrimidine photolyase